MGKRQKVNDEIDYPSLPIYFNFLAFQILLNSHLKKIKLITPTLANVRIKIHSLIHICNRHPFETCGPEWSSPKSANRHTHAILLSQLKNAQTGKERKVRFHTLRKLLGLVYYLDWIMIIISMSKMVLQLFVALCYWVMVNP